MDEDYKKVVEATRIIAKVCSKYYHFDREKKEIVCHEDCPFRYPKKYDDVFTCRLVNYPHDYYTEVERFEEEEEEGDEN